MTQTEDMKRITLFTIKRSWKKAAEAILDHLRKIGVNEDYTIYICHGGNEKSAKTILLQVKDYFPNISTKLMTLSPTMITHGGPGCVLIQAIKN